MIRDRRVARRQVDRIEWNVARVVLARGEPLDRGGHEAIRDAYVWR